MKFRKEDEHSPNYESYQIINETTKSIVAHGVPARYAELIESAPDLLESLRGMIESYDLFEQEFPEGIAKEVIRGFFKGESERYSKLKILTVS